jgi:hypothetical protein
MNDKIDGELMSAVKRAAWNDMAVLRQRRYDNLPKVHCSVSDCSGAPVKKLTVTANTLLGEQTSDIYVCAEHLLALNSGPSFSIGCKDGSSNY